MITRAKFASCKSGWTLVGFLCGCLLLMANTAAAGTLSVHVDSAQTATGLVTIAGNDQSCPTIPFTWDWGDGTVEDGWFPMQHTYQDRLRSYTVTVTAHYTGGSSDSVQVSVSFPSLPETFNFKQYLQPSTSTLTVSVQSVTPATGQVTIGGNDQSCPTTPFTWDWGDGTVEDGWFPMQHTYQNHTQNYVVTVTSHYSGGRTDSAQAVVHFGTPTVTPIALPASLMVTIPSYPLSFPNLSGLTYFDNSFFTTVPRSTIEYLLATAAMVQNGFLAGNIHAPGGVFQQVVLRDPNSSGGMYSLWFTTPVSFAAGNTAFQGAIPYSSFFHEMGHNFTLNFPANYYYGGKIDGNSSMIYSETMAQIFQHATAYELINNASLYGLSQDLVLDIKQDAISTITVLRNAYQAYCSTGMVFHSWNDPTTPQDDTFGTFMTFAYKFCQHAEDAGQGYAKPVRRLTSLLALFNADMQSRFDSQHNTPQADAFRATLMVTGLSFAFGGDLRGEFRNLGFPIDDSTYYQLRRSMFPADVNGDNFVGVGDLQALVLAWSSTPALGNWNAGADCNADGSVNIGDLQILIANWGKSVN